MVEIVLVRHAQSNFPNDELSGDGIVQAVKARSLLGQLFDRVFSSPQARAVSTALLTTGMTPTTDSRFGELEISAINCPTARAYVEAAHQQEPVLVQQKGLDMLQAVRDIALSGGTSLVVSHNLAISALHQQLTGEPNPVENLEGLKLKVGPGDLIQLLGRVTIK